VHYIEGWRARPIIVASSRDDAREGTVQVHRNPLSIQQESGEERERERERERGGEGGREKATLWRIAPPPFVTIPRIRDKPFPSRTHVNLIQRTCALVCVLLERPFVRLNAPLASHSKATAAAAAAAAAAAMAVVTGNSNSSNGSMSFLQQ